MDLDELVDHWTLLTDERELVAGKRGPTRLGFALLPPPGRIAPGSLLEVRVIACLALKADVDVFERREGRLPVRAARIAWRRCSRRTACCGCPTSPPISAAGRRFAPG